MSTIKTPTNEEIHAWGSEIGAEAGRSLANESDAFVGVTVASADAPEALHVYGRAFLLAFFRSYRRELRRLLLVRDDVVANTRLSTRQQTKTD